MNTVDSVIHPLSKKLSSRMLLGSILFILILVGGILFWVFRSPSGEREIQEVLETRARAFGQKDLLLYLSCFSPNYRGGGRTYDALKADASRFFSNYATVRFSFHTRNIRLQDDIAIVENNYTFFLTDADGESVRIANRELLEMRYENKEWKISKSLSIQ